MAYIYARYTDRVFVVRATSLVDLGIFFLVAFWFEKYEEYLLSENDGFGISKPPHRSHVFMQRLINDIRTDTFHFDWLLSSVAFLFWIRLIFLLQLTTTFGPLIRATLAMMKDLITFFLLFAIQLIAFTCVGILTFGSVPEYYTIQDALIMLIQTAFGEFDIEIYNDLGEGKKYFGQIFHLIVIIVNILLMLNLVIAIMSDTYSQLSEVKLGLYLQGIVESIPSYKNDKRYGGLICMTPPFNIFAYFLLPVYHWTKDKDKLARFNDRVCRITYFPFAVFFTTVFLFGSLIMAPVAWIKAAWFHVGQACGDRKKSCRALFYVFLGLFWFILIAIVDSCWFLRHQYIWKKTKTLAALDYPKISLRAFNRFYLTVSRIKGERCNAKNLVKKLESQFRTSECIFGVLYTNKSSFIKESKTAMENKDASLQAQGNLGTVKGAQVNIGKQYQHQILEGIDYNLRGLNTFNVFKRVVWSCVTERPASGELDETSEVNLPLLMGLLDEIKSEVYIEDLILKQEGEKDYDDFDISKVLGYTDYGPVSDHPRI